MAKALAALVLGLLSLLRPLLDLSGVKPWPEIAAAVMPAEINGGTGFFVNDQGDLVSAAHVLGHCPRPFVMTPGGIRTGRILAVSTGLDIAVARFDWAPEMTAVFPDYRPDLLWEPVTVTRFARCGGPASRTLLRAYAIGMVHAWAGSIALQADSPIRGGNSGSPVLDPQGAVVGMLVAREIRENRNGYAVSTEALQGFLRAAGVPLQTEEKRLPFLLGEDGDAALAYTYPVGCLL